MPFHIDTDGTRRRYSFQVQQGCGGGGGGNIVSLPKIIGPSVAEIGSTATLTATATSLLAGWWCICGDRMGGRRRSCGRRCIC